MKKTKIIATIWPSTDTKDKIKELYDNWVNVIRFNYSHSNYDYYSRIINYIDELNNSWLTNLSVLADTKWPEIRTKKTEDVVNLEINEEFLLTTTLKENLVDWNKKIIVADYQYLIEDVNVWRIIDIDTWLLKAIVTEKTDNYLVCKALNKHSIKSLRHLNLPWINIKLPWITEQDKNDLNFAITNTLDYIALSFVRNKWNIIELKDFLSEKKIEHVKIISKIESQEALDNLDDIIEYSDWIMIARWDLWAEIDFEYLPIIQREIAKKCKKSGKFFIVATQMLESMIDNPIPTRAELTDIFNAVMQKTDTVMLSWETAAWKYPIESVKAMVSVINATEHSLKYHHNYFTSELKKSNDKKLMVRDAIYTAENLEVDALILFTRTGFMAKTAAAFRPNIATYAFTFEDKLQKKLNILFWINSFVINKESNENNVINAIELLKTKWYLKTWKKIVTIYDIVKDNWDIIPSIQVRTI